MKKNIENFIVNKESGVILYNRNFIPKQMRLYIAWCITHPLRPKDFREIRCEKCKRYDNLEFHHRRYKRVLIKDIRIKCFKCHRNADEVKKNRRSQLKTIFENGKRICEVSGFRFEY